MKDSFYVYETYPKHARTCDICGKGMNQGYLNKVASEYYCSDECLDKTDVDQVELFGSGMLRWTDWEGECND